MGNQDIEAVDLKNDQVKMPNFHNQNDGEVLLSISQRGSNSQAPQSESETS